LKYQDVLKHKYHFMIVQYREFSFLLYILCCFWLNVDSASKPLHSETKYKLLIALLFDVAAMKVNLQ